VLESARTESEPEAMPAPSSASRWRARVHLARPSHWTKNAFVVAPLFFSLDVDEFDAVVRTALATIAFCATASAIYVLNDWSDRHEDARHPTKRTRPLASGALSGHDAVVEASVLALIAVFALLPLADRPTAWLPLLAYAAVNVGYSLWMRDVNLLDITVIAAGFVLRVLAGTGAVGVEPSSWIILCTGLLALLLALGKRRGDIGIESPIERASLAAYNITFIDLGLAMLAGAVITFYALFTVSDYSIERFETKYLYLTTFPVALSVLRYLQTLVSGRLSGSPTEILLRDRTLQFLIATWCVLFALLVTFAEDVT
jgi:decaprenyl-phosphate phosphoribosyltransferase